MIKMVVSGQIVEKWSAEDPFQFDHSCMPIFDLFLTPIHACATGGSEKPRLTVYRVDIWMPEKIE